MKSNNLRIFFSALLLTVTWQSETFAQGRSSSAVTDTSVPGSATFGETQNPSGFANPSLPSSDVLDQTREIINLNSNDPSFCPPLSRSADNTQRYEINPELASKIADTTGELTGVTNSMQAFAQTANVGLDTFGFSQADSLSFQSFLRGMPTEAQQGAQNLQARYLKRLKELHQDQDGNGFMDWIDELKKRGDLTQEGLVNLVWEGVLSKEEAASLGISEAELNEFNTKCRSKILGL